MSYSNDFRECVLNKISSGMSWQEASKFFKISTGSITRWFRNKHDRGTVSDPDRKIYKVRKIDPVLLKSAFKENPDATLEEMASQFNCWPQSIHKRCVQLGITRKKNYTIRGKK